MSPDFADALGVDFCRRNIGPQRVAYLPSCPPTWATMRLASATPIASNGSRLTASSPYALSSSPLSSPSWPSSPYCPPSHDEMAISEQCTRESRCTALRLLQHHAKNS